MSRPVGSKNKPKPVVNTDGYLEAFSGVGTNRDRSSYARPKGARLLDQNTLQDLYIGDGFGRKIVDSVAEEMTRSGIELQDLDDEAMTEYVESRLDELDAMRHFNDAVRWSRLFGGSIMIFGLNDGGTLDTPLNPDGVRDVEFLRVYDRYQATIERRVTDPQSMDYGKPEMWLITSHVGGNPYQVHHSRVWQFDGDSVPDLMRHANQGWGASSLQSCYDQLIRLGMGHQNVSSVLERSQQAVHKISELASTLRGPGGEQMIQKRMDIVDMVRGFLNTVAIDMNDEYTVQSTSMAGYPEVIDRFAEALSAVSGIPVSILMGRSQGGLSGTDQNIMESWHARIGSMWNDILRKPQDKLISWIIGAKVGVVPDYKLCMRPLSVMSDKEQAEVNKMNADAYKLRSDADVAYTNLGAITPDEVRGTLSEEYEFATETLTQEEIDYARGVVEPDPVVPAQE